MLNPKACGPTLLRFYSRTEWKFIYLLSFRGVGYVPVFFVILALPVAGEKCPEQLRRPNSVSLFTTAYLPPPPSPADQTCLVLSCFDSSKSMYIPPILPFEGTGINLFNFLAGHGLLFLVVLPKIQYPQQLHRSNSMCLIMAPSLTPLSSCSFYHCSRSLSDGRTP